MGEQVSTIGSTKVSALVAIVGLCALLSCSVYAQNSAIPLDFDAESFMRDLSGAVEDQGTEFTWAEAVGGIPTTPMQSRTFCAECSVIRILTPIVRVMIS